MSKIEDEKDGTEGTVLIRGDRIHVHDSWCGRCGQVRFEAMPLIIDGLKRLLRRFHATTYCIVPHHAFGYLRFDSIAPP